MPDRFVPAAVMGAIALALLAIVLYCAAFRVEAESRHAEKRVCFPASEWSNPNAPAKGLRPCGAIRRIYEDGSVVLAVEDANGTTRYTVGIGARDR
jgi:hypothetical protein